MRSSTQAPVLLRASSGPAIGLGHAMRSLAVAEAVARAGGEALLVVDDASSAQALGLRLATGSRCRVAAAGDAADWLRAPARSVWLDGFRDWTPELSVLRAASVPTLLVENRTPARLIATRVLYPALHHEDDAWDRAHAERVSSGAGWIPLRRAVLDAPAQAIRDVDLLVTFGGSDPLRQSERVLRLLAGDARKVVVAVGALMAPRQAALAKLIGALPRGSLLAPGSELAPWMARARSALTAVGTTLYELAHARVAALVLANHASDERALDWYARHGPHRPVGVAERVDDATLLDALRRPLARLSGPWPAELGEGAERLARLLLAGLEPLPCTR